MKALLFLFSFIFFITTCHGETEDYKQLLLKLDKLEALVVDGYELFHKKKIGENDIEVDSSSDGTRVNPLAYKIVDFVGKYLALQLPGHGHLLHMIKDLALNVNGLKYLVESYEEFNQLMHLVNFHYDLLRAKLNDMCAHEYCKIPEHLKITDNELDMLKKVVLGYRKPLDNIKDDIGKMEAFINKNKQTITKINELIAAENVKAYGQNNNGAVIVGQLTDGNPTVRGSADAAQSSGLLHIPSTSTNQDYNKQKTTYQAIYNIIFYTNQLEEAQKLIEVLEKRVNVLKEHKSIKALLDQVATEKENLAKNTNTSTGDVTTVQKEAQDKITDLEKQITAIANTVNFDMGGVFTNPEELDYYLREKAKMAGTLVTPESTKSISAPGKTVPTMKETYPHGITYALPESTILELIENIESQESFGDLQNPDDGQQPNKGIIINAGTRKLLLDKIMNKIQEEEEKLPELQQEYDQKMEVYKQKLQAFLPSLNHFYEARLNNTLVAEKFDEFKTNREAYLKEKNELEKCTYEQNINLINKLKKQVTYLEDYTLRKDIADDEINYYSDMEWKIKNEIYELAREIQKNEIKLIVENKFDFSGVLELQVQKVLMLKKIEALKNAQNLLKNAKVKNGLYIPKVYKSGDKPEPYYLIVLKKEIDKLKDFIPKIETMITTEKAKSVTAPVVIKGQSLRGASETKETATTSPVGDAVGAAGQQGTGQTATEGSAGQGEQAVTETEETPTPTAQTEKSESVVEKSTHETTTTGGPTVEESAITDKQPAESEATHETPPAAIGEGAQTTSSPEEPTEAEAEVPAPGKSATTAEEPAQKTEAPADAAAATTPAPAPVPAVPTMSKLEYLEKLLDFLKSAYACHKHIFLTNTTMNPELLKQYKLTPDEQNRINHNSCDELDLLFNIQNNLPAMYSIYDTMINDLQNLYIDLYQKEMIYNIYKRKDTDTKIKAFLEASNSNAAAAVAPAPASAAPPTTPSTTSPTTSPAVAPAQSAVNVTDTVVTNPVATTTTTTTPTTTTTTTTVTPGTQDSDATNTQTTLQTEQNVSVIASNEDEPKVTIVQMEKPYDRHLSQMDTYNDYFAKFLESQKENINNMNKEQWETLGAEIEQLKEKIQVSLDHYGKYKLKLERFMKKKKKISNSKEHIKKLTSLKNKLEKRKKFLNNPSSVLKNYTVFFNKKKEAERKEVENTLKNTELLLKYYKAQAKYYIGEPFPLKTLSEEFLQKEDNYLNLEKFRVLSRMEGRLGNNINLEKETITYLSSGLHHVFTELKEIISNKRYTGSDHKKNSEAVKKALQEYQDLLPKVATKASPSLPAAPAAPAQPVTPPVTPAEETEESEESAPTAPPVKQEAGPTAESPVAAETAAPAAPAQPVTPPVTPAEETAAGTVQTTPAAGGEGQTGQTTQDVQAQDYDEVIALPLFGNNDDDGDYDEEDQVTTGEAENAQPEVIIPEGISEYEVVYIKPLAGIYNTIKKQLANHVAAFNTNIIDMLDSRLKKRNYFLSVLESDFNPFKYSSSGEYIMKDPYKLLDYEQKKKLLGSYKYISASIDKDIATAKDGLAYFNKMSELYKNHMDAVHAHIQSIENDDSETDGDQLNAKNEEAKKYLPFLNSIQKEYETLMNKVHIYTDNLKKFMNKYPIEKKETEIIVNKLENYTKMDEKLEIFKQSKKETDVRSSGLLEKFKSSKLINEEESKKVLSKLLNVQTQLLHLSSDHKCIDTVVPDNAACYRYLDGTEEWRCLLTFKEVSGKCVPAPNMTCMDNNGGCAPEAECSMPDNKEIVCKCTREGSEPLFQGVFCSSSSFLSLSFLLLILLFLLCMEL
uniref:Merozoite surface protein 1 n=1 Tax=Plasmodium fragile TaxID=5857 RepID=A7BG16_PLAFR|nr:merozoite surface protein-1 [Plasmodium fragile]BAI82256.1 merozoite surface protein 1 [Plasmodium fragile]